MSPNHTVPDNFALILADGVSNGYSNGGSSAWD